jgi:hypothetical protein
MKDLERKPFQTVSREAVKTAPFLGNYHQHLAEGACRKTAPVLTEFTVVETLPTSGVGRVRSVPPA